MWGILLTFLLSKDFQLILGSVVLLVPMAFTLVFSQMMQFSCNNYGIIQGPRYGISNPALIGACFLPSGIGNIHKSWIIESTTTATASHAPLVGAPLAGRLSDRTIINGRVKRGGKWVPEDRLMGTFPGGLLLVPLSVMISGLPMEFVPGRTGLLINLICLFANGVVGGLCSCF